MFSSRPLTDSGYPGQARATDAACPTQAVVSTWAVRFLADFHIHSKYSRATSRDCDLEHLALGMEEKGLHVIGTGDFTHPAWRREIGEKLQPAEPGFFRLKAGLEKSLGLRGRAQPRFMLSVEISSIYKKKGKVRKNHNLVLAPSLDAADRIIKSLRKIGNLDSDGRPILGLASKNLLEIVLESDPDSYLIPAHIWTPWFSVFGSKSGYDQLEDCYEDLLPKVFALETGLSSDPLMNGRLSALDRFRLVSNSDAHSPGKLGREATVFDGAFDYFSIKKALESGRGYAGTLEFFPEEGKYHLDGHRDCGLRLEPKESRKLKGRCPSCGKALTIGVLSRVEELADRPEGKGPHRGFQSIIPLPEILGEILDQGPATKKVVAEYKRLIAALGSEFHILLDAPPEDLRRVGGEVLAEALARMRRGQVRRSAGFDGQFGVISLFEPQELKNLGQTGL